MGAGAPKGNKNAEKWTLETSTELLDKALSMVHDKEKRIIKVGKENKEVESPKYDFIGELSTDLGIHRQTITYDIYNKFPELHDKIKLLLSIIESNCFRNTKKGNIREATGIVNLKSNYGWTDRVANENNNKEVSMSPEEENERIKQLLQQLKENGVDLNDI